MPLLERGGRIVDDPWVTVGDDEPLPAGGGAVVSLARLPVDHSGPLGVTLANDLDVTGLDVEWDGISLVVLDFPSFADGRAYSQARVLRNNLAYGGELRAGGHFLPDQLGFLIEVGFDSFDLQKDRFPVERWTEALNAVTLTYHRHLRRAGQSPIVAARHADPRSDSGNAAKRSECAFAESDPASATASAGSGAGNL